MGMTGHVIGTGAERTWVIKTGHTNLWIDICNQIRRTFIMLFVFQCLLYSLFR